jgi:hypothetical protein
MNIIFKIILLLLIIGMGVMTYSIFDNKDVEQSEVITDDDDNIPSRVVKVEGQLAVRLDMALQAQNGIKTQSVEPMDLQTEVDAFGRVFNINGLVELRSNVNKINGEKNIVLSELSAANKKLNRLKVLHKEAANISTRQLQEVEAESKTQQAKLNTLNSKLTDVRTEAEQAWGTVLTSWVLDNQSDAFEKILSGEEVILLVALRAEDTLPDNTQTIYIGRNGKRSSAQKAYYISPAIESDRVLQGETYYFRAEANKSQYRANMHVHVWIPQSTDSISGVFVPESAVVWSSGKSWIYVKNGKETFIKHVINDPVVLGDGLFVANGLVAGDEVVSSGAQMLLAEEYRWSIPDEDDNP